MVWFIIHTTNIPIQTGVALVKTKLAFRWFHGFFMCLPDQKPFTDCAINPKPNRTRAAEIAISSAETSASFGVET
jgi:phosphate acetyltransferase